MATTRKTQKTTKNAVTPKPLKPDKKKDWKALSPEAALRAIKTACHLTSKSVNSNVGVGVRLAATDRLDLPYVAVSTLGTALIPVDYVTNASDSARLWQVASVLDGSANTVYNSIAQGQIDMIESMRGLMESGASHETGWVDPRLRQVIWPTGDSTAPWLALTPLQSSGVSDVIRRRLAQESANHIDPKTGKTTIRRANAVLGFGGSKPLNVGRHVSAMQRPLVFHAPQENPDLRKALSLYFKGYLHGLPFCAPTKETERYALWRHPLMRNGRNAIPSNMEMREEERQHIHAITLAAVALADQARETLKQHRDVLAKKPSTLSDPFLLAMVDPDLRDRDFWKAFAKKLISSIERFPYKLAGGAYTICDEGGLADLISVAEEVLP